MNSKTGLCKPAHHLSQNHADSTQLITPIRHHHHLYSLIRDTSEVLSTII